MNNNNKLIVFDLLCAQPFGGIKFHGAGEYTKVIFNRVVELNKSAQIVVCYDKDLFLDEWIEKAIADNKLTIHNVRSYREIVDFANQCAERQDVTFYAGLANQYPYANFDSRIHTIGTCHGLRSIEKDYDKTMFRYAKTFKNFVQCLYFTIFRKKLYAQNIKSHGAFLSVFDTIVTVSNHSRYAISICYPRLFKEKDIRTFYTPSKIAEIIDTPIEKEKYILMVSADRWIKNAYRGLLAIDDMYSKGLLGDVKTHVYGSCPDQIKMKMKNAGQFKFYDYVSSKELEEAYSQCDVFFYPTLNEGFGMPPSEAQKYGKTCVISGVASLPEVYSNSVYYCNPYDIREMQNRLLDAIENKIPEGIIETNLDRIHKKQLEDLDKLAQLILGNYQ